MPTSCSVQSCLNNKNKNKDLSFHRFPPDKELRKIWVQKCFRKDKMNLNTGRICSAHFLDTDFERDMQNELLNLPPKKILKTEAVPSINLPKIIQSSSAAIQRNERMDLKRKKTERDEMIASALITPEDETPPQVEVSSMNNNCSVEGDLSELLLQESQEKYTALEKDFADLQNKLSEARRTIKVLRTAISRLQKKAKQAKFVDQESKKLKKQNAAYQKEKRLWRMQNKIKENFWMGANKIFTSNQIKLISGTQSKVKWTSEEISQAFTIRFLGLKGYIFMRKELHYPFPGLSTLQNWAQNIDLKNGFIDGVLKLMGRIGANMDAFQKQTVLLFDEMKVQECYEYDVRYDEVVGPCKQMQVIMARGLTSKWKQVIFIDFDKKMTKEILFEAIKLLRLINFNVVACVSDMGGGNISLMNQLHVNKDNPSFLCPESDQPVIYFPDAPHLLKLTRNWLVDYGFSHNGNIISAAPIRELIKVSDRTEVRASHKLTDDHLPKKGSFLRQNVRKASQVLSHTTAKCLRYFKDKGILTGDHCDSTADFADMVDRWFDLVNVRYPDYGKFTPSQKKAYGLALEEQNDILDAMSKTIREIKVLNSRTSTLQIFQKGIIQHINATKMLYENLYPQGLRYLLSNKTNQDALENFFMQERIHCGSNKTPTPLQAKQNARLIFLGKNPGAVVKQKNTLEQNDKTTEEFILAKGLAPNSEHEPDENENTDSINISEESQEEEDELPVFETDFQSEYEDSENEDDPDPIDPYTLQPALQHPAEETSEISKTCTTEEEGHEWLCGWIAMKCNNHTHLRVPKEKECRNTDHPYNVPSFVEFVSEGGLVVPTNDFLIVGKKLDGIFKDVCGDDFKRGPGIVAELCDEANLRLDDVDRKITPPDVVRRYMKQRVFIRMKHKNDHLKERHMKKRLKQIEKLISIAT